ncbi:MAG: hypothetical protein C5B60_00915 [Chloroflexi bacterium]|nr:MAG: hypothetical protein C5B60_00915 [Chloroflexota bacterium]
MEGYDLVKQEAGSHKSGRPVLKTPLDPQPMLLVLLMVISILFFAVGYGLSSTILQTLGALLFGAEIAAIVGGLTARGAIHQQSTKEANIWRKEHSYGPLYAELKAVRAALSDAKAGKAPLPLRFDNGVDVPRAIIFYQTSPFTLLQWPELRRGYHDTDFRLPTREQLDRVDECATSYNTAIEAARQTAVSFLASYINIAIAALPQSEDYQQRHQQTKHKAPRDLAGDQQNLPDDWYGYIEFVVEFISAPRGDTAGQQLADQWLSHWPDPVSLSPVSGWLLAERPDKAAAYVSDSYPAALQNLPLKTPPPREWIQAIFELAWPDLQQDTQFCAAIEARDNLFKQVQVAVDLLDRGLRDIQRLFEGGDPLV